MTNTAAKIRNAVGQLFDRGTHMSVASSTQFIAKKLGLREKWIEYTHVEIRNKANEVTYMKTPYSERVLFLPHCMRSMQKCKAAYDENGLHCRECGACKLGTLVKMARDRGYSAVFICPGGSMVKKKVKESKPKAILGVACFDEAQMAFNALRGTRIGVQAVLLSKAGCANTDVDIEEVREKMDLIDKNLNEKKNAREKAKKR